jgi:hypothetical protein
MDMRKQCGELLDDNDGIIVVQKQDGEDYYCWNCASRELETAFARVQLAS